jgi:hypothetical protein
MTADCEPHPRARSRNSLHHTSRIRRRRNRKKKIRFRARNIVHVEFLHARLCHFCGAHRRFREIVIKLHSDAVLRRSGNGRICSLLRVALLRATLLRARGLRRGTRLARRCRLLPATIARRCITGRAGARYRLVNESSPPRRQQREGENGGVSAAIRQRCFSSQRPIRRYRPPRPASPRYHYGHARWKRRAESDCPALTARFAVAI